MEHDHPKNKLDISTLPQQEYEALFTELASDRRAPAFLSRVGGIAAIASGIEVRIDTPEEQLKRKIELQFGDAYRVFGVVTDKLNRLFTHTRIPKLEKEQMSNEFNQWLTGEKLHYMAEAIEREPDQQFILVATPNVPVSRRRILEFAENTLDELTSAHPFDEFHPGTYSRGFYDEVIRKFTAEELSGYNPDNSSGVRFRLIPLIPDPEFIGTVDEQREKLQKAKVQEVNDFLCVPSLLDATVYWRVLASQLIDYQNVDNTNIRHFDLRPRRRTGLGMWVVDSGGNVLDDKFITGSLVEERGYGRVAIG